MSERFEAERKQMPSVSPQDCTPPGAGFERAEAVIPAWRWMASVLDEIDYGVLLVTGDTQVVHMNHLARIELDGRHPLQLLGRELRARRPQDVAPLNEALTSASMRGLRRLLTLGDDDFRVPIAVVPLAVGPVEGGHVTMLTMGKRQVCEDLSLQGCARAHGLTPAETGVLKALCAGEEPHDIARRHGVALSTIRTQIGSIRDKFGSQSIRDLLLRLSLLPPMVSALRSSGAPMGAIAPNEAAWWQQHAG